MVRRWRRWQLAPLIVAGLLILSLLLHQRDEWTLDHKAGSQGRLIETANIQNVTVPATAKQIRFGIEVLNINSLDLHEMTFQATGWYWLKWDQAIQEMLERNKIPIESVVKPLNLVEPWFSKFETSEEGVIKISDNEYYLATSFAGTFFFNELDKSKAPFIDVWTPLNFEIDPDKLALGQANEVYLTPDKSFTGEYLVSYGDEAGFKAKSAFLGSYINTYPGSFGLGSKPKTFAGIQLDVIYQANFWAAFIEYFLPPLLVFLFMVTTPLVHPWEVDFRMIIPSTSVLALIFLQSFTNERLPPSPTLSYIDQIFAYMYVVSFVYAIMLTWSANKADRFAQNPNPEALRKIAQVERIVMTSSIIGLLVFGTVEWLL